MATYLAKQVLFACYFCCGKPVNQYRCLAVTPRMVKMLGLWTLTEDDSGLSRAGSIH
jgi:hypothetical protein